MSNTLIQEIETCTLCADRFAATHTAHSPRPVVWFRPGARILIVGQAPGARVHESGRPFTDPSGDRLRDWLGLDEAAFYDRDQLAIVPMAFCFPGYNPKGSDLPPPPICARTWRARVMEVLGDMRLTVVIGGYAQKWHLGDDWRGSVTATVAAWQDLPPHIVPLPHPSWRNNAWIRKNPWFETDLLPHLRAQVQGAVAP